MFFVKVLIWYKHIHDISRTTKEWVECIVLYSWKLLFLFTMRATNLSPNKTALMVYFKFKETALHFHKTWEYEINFKLYTFVETYVKRQNIKFKFIKRLIKIINQITQVCASLTCHDTPQRTEHFDTWKL